MNSLTESWCCYWRIAIKLIHIAVARADKASYSLFESHRVGGGVFDKNRL